MQVTRLAGSEHGFADGKLLSSRFNWPSGLCIDSRGVVFVADRGNHVIRKLIVTSYGKSNVTQPVSTFCGQPATGGMVDGKAENARFSIISSITIDRNGRSNE
jgi:hypothetical protein